MCANFENSVRNIQLYISQLNGKFTLEISRTMRNFIYRFRQPKRFPFKETQT